MKSVSWVARVAAVAAVLLLSACATSGGDRGYRGMSTGVTRVDSQKVAAVENIARKRGVAVVWINYPEIQPDRDNR